MADNKEAVGKIFQLIPKIAGEIGSIGKEQRNQKQNFAFRGIDDVYNKVGPLLAKNGVFSMPQVLEYDLKLQERDDGKKFHHAKLTVMYRFFAEDGSSVEVIVPGEAVDFGDKATSKAMAIAHKYALFQIFAIPVEGTDPDAEAYDVNERSNGSNGNGANGHKPKNANGNGSVMKEFEKLLGKAVDDGVIKKQDKEDTLARAAKYTTPEALTGYLNAVKASVTKKRDEKKAEQVFGEGAEKKAEEPQKAEAEIY